WKVRDGVPARVSRGTQRQDRGVRARPRPRRIPNEHRTAALAVTRRGEEARTAQLAPRRRRHADEIDTFESVEREQPGALGVRADDVVVREILAVGARLLHRYIRNRL